MFGVPLVFLRPLVSDSHLFGVRPWSTRLWTFLGDDIWKESVFSSWFNTGYMFTSVSRGFWVASRRSYVKVDSDPAVLSARSHLPFSDEEVTALVLDNSGTAGFAGYDAMHLVLCSCVVAWPKMLRIMAGMDQKDSYAVGRENW